MHVNEVRYTNISKFDSKLCHLDLEECCIFYDNIFDEISHPTCVFISTEPSKGEEDDAYSLPQPLSISTGESWTGLIFLLSLIIIFLVLLFVTFCMSGYTLYRKKHPQGHCLRLDVNGHVCIC